MALQPPFLAQKYTFWSYDPRRIRRVVDTRIRRRYAPLTRRSICRLWRLDISPTGIRYVLPCGKTRFGEKRQGAKRLSLRKAQHIECERSEHISSLSVAKTYRVAKQHIDIPKVLISSCEATYRQNKGVVKNGESTYKDLKNKCGSIRRRLIAFITTAKENA